MGRELVSEIDLKVMREITKTNITLFAPYVRSSSMGACAWLDEGGNRSSGDNVG